jgi:hypothetical protein
MFHPCFKWTARIGRQLPARSLGALPPPSPPAEKAAARQDKAGKSGTRDGAGDGGELENCYIDAGVKIKCRATIERVAPRQA